MNFFKSIRAHPGSLDRAPLAMGLIFVPAEFVDTSMKITFFFSVRLITYIFIITIIKFSLKIEKKNICKNDDLQVKY